MTFSQPFNIKRRDSSDSLGAMSASEEQREIDADKELAEYQACLSKPEEAQEPALKKARSTKVHDIKTLCFKNLSLKKPISINKDISTEFTHLDEAGTPWVLNMTPAKENWLNTTFGVETEDNYQHKKFAIVTGDPSHDQRKYLKMELSLPAEHLDKLAALEDATQKASKFKGKFHNSFNDTSLKNARLHMEGNNVTKFQVVVMDGETKKVVGGAGWSFIKDYIFAYSNFKGCRVKVVLRAPRNYSTSNCKGTAWDVEQLAIDTTTQKVSGVERAEQQFGEDDLL